MLETFKAFLSNADLMTIGRGVAFLLLVMGTISLIARVYGNITYGPVALKPGLNLVRSQKDMLIPAAMLGSNIEGLRADVDIFYISENHGGRKKRLIHAVKGLNVSGVGRRISTNKDTLFGIEIPEGIETIDVFLSSDPDAPLSDRVEASPQFASEAAKTIVSSRRLEMMETASVVQMGRTLVERIDGNREEYIWDCVNRLRRVRESKWLRPLLGRVARQRPNPIGEYSIRIKLRSDPFFVLSRHPDRNLRMTAWLTLLTSAFSFLLDVWRS